MTAIDLPAPVVRAPRPMTAADVDVGALSAALSGRVDGEVRFDKGSIGAYSTDASNYRQLPLGVVVPRTVDAVVQTVAVCREFGVPVLNRGGGTSLAGECTNAAVVIDWTKYCHRIESLDVERKTAWVEPGIVLDDLKDRLSDHRLMFGPKPSTHANCALGGMIGNNSCGSTAQAYGKTVDNVLRLDILLYDGTRLTVGKTPDDELAQLCGRDDRVGEIYRGLVALRDRYADQIRRRYPDIPRRVSGQNLDALLPENGFDVAQLIVGSESTLATVLRAELQLVDVPKYSSMALIGYDSIADAARHMDVALKYDPQALEGLDDKLTSLEKHERMNPDALKKLPAGKGFLMVEFAGDDEDEVRDKAQRLVEEAKGDARGAEAFLEPHEMEQMWSIRESGLGATAHVPGGPDTWPGWEDSAVAPHNLPDYLDELQELFDRYGFGDATLYGHFGQGCVHTNIAFDLQTVEGIATFRRFMNDAADLCIRYDGSLSGEHGDGQARGELLPKMFGETIVRAFGECKALFDPDDRMNPGKVVAPYRMDENLRYGADYRPKYVDTHFAFPHDGGTIAGAAARCVGVGKCRSLTGGVMCPSYRATREEEHSTRGRARLLFEMMRNDGAVADDGWRSKDVHDALDLCLACKGCKHDCPVSTDMATYKAEFYSHYYEGRLRPRSHYAMGWLPLWAHFAQMAPRAVNAVTAAPGVRSLLKLAGGIAQQRDIPVFASETFADWYRRRGPRGTGFRGDVVVWPDTFTNNFDPHIGKAAVEVLEDAGFRAVVPDAAVCCGLTWISTGQLDTAKKVLRRTIDVLAPHLEAGTPILGLEPSCTAVFRSDAPELFPGDVEVERLRQQTKTIGELLKERAPDWRPRGRIDAHAIVQRHCHQYAIMGYDAERDLLSACGADLQVLDDGCCGLAGNFGFEAEHYDVSMKVAEHAFLPDLRKAAPTDVLIADGFSCRTQVEQSDVPRRPVHAVELLAAAVRGETFGAANPEDTLAERPEPERRAGRLLSVAVAVGVVSGAAAAGRALRGRRR